MTFQLCDIDGYVGDLASIRGLNEMSDLVLSHSTSKPVKQFFLYGQSPVTSDLIEGLKALTSENRDIQETLDNLIVLLGKAKKVAIISDGTVFDDEPMWDKPEADTNEMT